MNPRPDLYRPADSTELIGPAAHVCDCYLREIRADLAAGNKPPFKLLLLGEPGLGKTTVATILARALAGDTMNIEHLNGTDLAIDKVRAIKSRFGLASLFGDYQGILCDELENAPPKAQIDMLTTLDKLPSGWFFIGTTNNSLSDFEPRFQSRFEQVSITRPSDTDIANLLTGKFQVPASIATPIAAAAAGNVRAAMLDAKQWFTANPDTQAA